MVLPQGSHPFPSRTRKLSLAGPMILRWKRRGNVGHRQGLKNQGPQARKRLRPFLCGALSMFDNLAAQPCPWRFLSPTSTLSDLLACSMAVRDRRNRRMRTRMYCGVAGESGRPFPPYADCRIKEIGAQVRRDASLLALPGTRLRCPVFASSTVKWLSRML